MKRSSLLFSLALLPNERLGRRSWAAAPASVFVLACTAVAGFCLFLAQGAPLAVLAAGLLAGVWLSVLVVTKL